MTRKSTDFEKQLNNVLVYHDKELKEISFPDTHELELEISKVEQQLRKLGIDPSSAKKQSKKQAPRKELVVPSWDEVRKAAEAAVGADNDIKDLFTEEELIANKKVIKNLNAEYTDLHKLDNIDVTIAAIAAIIGGAVDILMVGIPQKGYSGLEAGSLANYIRGKFDKAFPPDVMEQLGKTKICQVPYDAQDNRNTSEYVEGLSSYYHRLLSVGHDPLLGFVVGVFDILTGRMTTIDKSGKVVSQVMDNYDDRKESDIFAAIAKQVMHLKTDVTTSMGLPAPMMELFNLLQFGSVAEEELTIAEIVQGMYYEGYDFVHFCAASIPVMLVEVIVRLGYAIKRIREGHTIGESIPVSLDREKNPKLSTMLFIGNTGAAAINAGKIYFSKNPMAINYPQWISFARYSYKQVKWILIEKPEAQEKYVDGKLYEELVDLSSKVNHEFEEYFKDYVIVMDNN